MRVLKWIKCALMCVVAAAAAAGESVPSSTPRPAAEFKQAAAVRAFTFPNDHGTHPGYQTEWWYVTGTLQDATGRRFGYQFTIFRRAVSPESNRARGRSSAWAVEDLYLAQAALSDIGGGTFHNGETLQRGALGLAGAEPVVDEANPAASAGTESRVWVNGWALKRSGKTWSVNAAFGGVAYDLTFEEQAAPVLHGKPGEEGLSRKGPGHGQASYYYSLTGLKTRGSVTLKGQRFEIVSGLSWLDREWGSNQLSDTQAGWDWFAIQFTDGSALMLYILRNTDGTREPASSGTFTDAAGKRTHIALGDVKLTPGQTWTSPHSHGTYTLGWKIEIPVLKLALGVEPMLPDQEVKPSEQTGIAYYEGAIRVSGTRESRAIEGEGYLEITGAPGQKKGATELGRAL